ncbi:unnamed protein product [Arctogadus glacialis]
MTTETIQTKISYTDERAARWHHSQRQTHAMMNPVRSQDSSAVKWITASQPTMLINPFKVNQTLCESPRPGSHREQRSYSLQTPLCSWWVWSAVGDPRSDWLSEGDTHTNLPALIREGF